MSLKPTKKTNVITKQKTIKRPMMETENKVHIRKGSKDTLQDDDILFQNPKQIERYDELLEDQFKIICGQKSNVGLKAC